METKERNILLDLYKLSKKIDLEDKDIKYLVKDIALQIRTGLNKEKEDLIYRIEKIDKDLELIRELGD